MSAYNPLKHARHLADIGWHVLPLTATNKRPLSNCHDCASIRGRPAHAITECPCLPAGGWCHGVRAATTNPEHITTWWTRAPEAIPGIATGPSRLVLIDIDHHHDQLPPNLATGLLPGINLADELLPPETWNQTGRIHDGHDTLALLAQLRGGQQPWPDDLGHQPVVTETPSGGHHLWYRAPAANLHQVLADPAGRYGLAWQVDIKAGWSYGIAPGTHAASGTYHHTAGDITALGRMPTWLAQAVTRVAGPPTHPARPTPQIPAPTTAGPKYLTTVINRGADAIKRLDDGRQRALSALAYQAGGLLTWSGLAETDVTNQLINAGTRAGLPERIATRTVTRALTNGQQRPLGGPRRRY